MTSLRWLVVVLLIGVLALVVGSRLIGAKSDQESETEIEATSFTGVVTDIESSGLNEVASFVVRHDGTTTTVYVRDDFDYGFPVGHLQAHLTSGDPVVVDGTLIDGKLYADSIEDA